jgi:hypothetical protein
VYEKVANMKIAIESFQATGLHPLSPDVFPGEDFLPSEVMNRLKGNLKENPLGENGKELQMPVSVEKKAAAWLYNYK